MVLGGIGETCFSVIPMLSPSLATLLWVRQALMSVSDDAKLFVMSSGADSGQALMSVSSSPLKKCIFIAVRPLNQPIHLIDDAE